MLVNLRYAWVINFLTFQIGWLVCVLGGDLWAVLFTLPVLFLHNRYYPEGAKDKLAVVLMVVIGLCHDNVLGWAGVLIFEEQSLSSPPWLWCLWILLGLTLNHSLLWIYSRPWISAIAGAISGPLAYVAGVALSDIEWGVSIVQASVIMAGVWFFILPLHRYLIHKVELLWL